MQIHHFTNLEVKKGSFIGFHYNISDNSKVVVPYTSSNGVGSRSLQLFGQNQGSVKFDADLPPGVTLPSSQPASRIPMATFFVNSRGM